MKADEFIGHVQHRARMDSRFAAAKATEATLQTLAERLAGGAAANLASQLPPEIGAHLAKGDVEVAAEMDLRDFFERVSEREGVDLPKSIFHARCVIDVLQDAVSEGQIDKVKAQLPSEWDRLFDAGSEGGMDLDRDE